MRLNVASDIKVRTYWILNYCKGKSVLDVGCVGEKYPPTSPKSLHRMISKVSTFCIGIDTNREGIELMKKLGYNVIIADAENFKLPYKFDRIVASEVIEHLSNPGLFLDCVKEHLKPSGLLILTTPNARSLRHFLLNWSDSFDHKLLFNLQTLVQLLLFKGFKIVEVQYLLYDDPNSYPFLSRLYMKTFLKIFPKFANTLGVVATPRA